jgi:hypothetical protein
MLGQEMPRFRILIHGQNFLLDVEGKQERLGFYTPRFVDAPDAEMAERVAMEDFRTSAQGRELIAAALNPPDDPPVLEGRIIESVTAAMGAGPPIGELAFYSEARKTDQV